MQNYNKFIYLIVDSLYVHTYMKLLDQHSFYICTKVYTFDTYVYRKRNKWLFASSKGNKMRTTALIMSIKYVLTFLRFQLQLP